jgi:hypothetical protein
MCTVIVNTFKTLKMNDINYSMSITYRWIILKQNSFHVETSYGVYLVSYPVDTSYSVFLSVGVKKAMITFYLVLRLSMRGSLSLYSQSSCITLFSGIGTS